jgi:hypothetical protein
LVAAGWHNPPGDPGYVRDVQLPADDVPSWVADTAVTVLRDVLGVPPDTPLAGPTRLWSTLPGADRA